MFSHSINNKFILNTKNDYNIIPFGHRCSSALACKYANIRKYSLPFDWIKPCFPGKIQQLLENNFENFIPNVCVGKFTNKYDIYFPHFNSDINKGIDDYKRRIIRLNCILNEPTKIYFVYINEDYLYNNTYRQDTFLENNFLEMLTLETYLKNKYSTIDFNILYFDFKTHTIPDNSNILQILLHTTTVYNTVNSAPYEKLRNYCGKILAELFETNLVTGYDDTTFHDTI